MKKVDKIIIYSVLGILPACILLSFFYFIFWGRTTEQVIREKDSLLNFNGVVNTLYDDQRNHNARTAIFTNNLIITIVPDWDNKIKIGDSLNKKEGSFFLEVYRGKTKILFDYRTTIVHKTR